jgi:hypothetical protein
MMESPQKKPAAFGTAFGTENTATPSAAPFSFGQSSQSGASPGFGASATTQPSTSIFNFGQSQAAAQPGNLFGYGAQEPEEPKSQTALFGQSLNTSQPPANPFGQPTSAPSSSSSIFNKSMSAFNPPSNLFGQTSATSASTGNIFGSSAPATQPPNGGPFNTLFGQASVATKPTTDAQTSSEVSKPTFSFASSTSQPAFSFSAAPMSTSNTTSSNLTAQVTDSTPASSAHDSARPVFSGLSASSPFGDIFKPNANARLSSPETTTMSTETPSAISHPFTFKQDSYSQPGLSSSEGLFGPKQSVNNTSGRLFERPTSPEPASTTDVPVASQKPAQDEQEPRPTSDNGTSATNLFGKPSKLEQAPQPAFEPTKPQAKPNQCFTGFQPQPSTQQPASSSHSSFGNLFGASSNKPSSATQQEKPTWNSSSDSSLFPRASAAGLQNASSNPAESQAKQPSEPGTKATTLPAKSSSAGGPTPSASSKAPAAPQFTAPASKGTASAIAESDIRLRSYGSSAIPSYLDSDESVEHDSLSRLRNLNTSFQKNIAKLDPAEDDFEEIVRHYVAQRARIGYSLNLKERNKAGMKRKMDNSEANEEPLNLSKKARTEGFAFGSINVEIPPVATENRSTSAIAQSPDTLTTQSTFKATAQSSNTGSSSATSSIFKNMMSSPAPTSSASSPMSGASQNSGNPFASLKASAPSSTTLTPSGAGAADPGISKDNVQSSNPVASLSAPSSTTSGSATVSSSAPLFKPQVPSTTPAKSPPKKPVFEVPQFGTSSGTSFMDAFARQSAKSAAELQEEAKRKRKAEDFDSDEDDEAEWERKYAEEERAKRNKLESLSKAGSTGFQPLFGGKETSATAKTFFNLANKTSNVGSGPGPETSLTGFAGFGSAVEPAKAAEEPANTSDEGSNGSRSSEEQGESASQEEASDRSSEGGDGDDDEDASEGDHNYEEDEAGEEQTTENESDDEDIQAAMARSKPKGSLFDRIEPNPNLKPKDASQNGAQNEPKKPNGISSTLFEAKATPNGPKASQATINSSLKPSGANGVPKSGAFTSTLNTPTISPFTPINGSGSDTPDPFVPVGSLFAASKKPEIEHASSSKKIYGEKFSFAPNTSAPAPSAARSVLFGGNTSLGSGAIPGEGLFGSRPSTPSHDEPARGSVFGNLGSGPNFSNSQSDRTYQRGSPLKFGTPNKEGPTVNITAATPPAKDDSSAASKSFPNLFGPKPSNPGADAVANVGFNFGGPTHLTASPLLGPSALSSAVSSRATSPGATDTESVNTDTAEDHSDEPQTSLISSRAGEENEEVLFEARSKALKLITEEAAKEKKLDPGFITQGVGQLRVLKHKTTGKARLLLRAEPGSNIVINTALTPSMTYKATETKGSGAVKFGIPTATGIDHWVVKVKTAVMAEELARILEANKGDAVHE